MSTITTLNDGISANSFRTQTNTNFANLNTDKEEIANKSTSVTTDQTSNTKYPSVKSVYDWAVGAFAKYSGDADFYQYSIVRTVASGNLTVALKNYEGNDPTTLKPVKIMIGGVVRTITSALSTNFNSGTNNLNLGSAELATKEVDLFLYIGFDTTSSTIKMLWARIPYALTKADFTWSFTSEKGIGGDVGTYVSTDSVVNIGRFNAILSAGFVWSIPATDVVVNRPMYETRPLDFIPFVVGTGTIGSYSVQSGRYTIKGGKISGFISVYSTNKGTLSGNTGITLPFSIPSNTPIDVPQTGYLTNLGDSPNAKKGEAYLTIASNNIGFFTAYRSTLLQWSGITAPFVCLVSFSFDI